MPPRRRPAAGVLRGPRPRLGRTGQARGRQGRGRDHQAARAGTPGERQRRAGVRWLDGPAIGNSSRTWRDRPRCSPHHGHRRLPGDRALLRRRRAPARRAGASWAGGDGRGRAGAVCVSLLLAGRTGCPGWSSAPGCRPTCSLRRPGTRAAPEIIPFRGEYLRLRPHARDRVRHLIYPVPDPKYPFLGVHLTPRIDGESDLGPNAVLALAREGYRRRDVSAAELARLARSASFWRLAGKNWRTGVREIRGSLSRRAFLAEARTYLPWLEPGDVMPAPAGVRAQAVDPDGSLVDDFRINRIGPVTTRCRNAPSPAATASMAIAEHIVAALDLPPG